MHLRLTVSPRVIVYFVEGGCTRVIAPSVWSQLFAMCDVVLWQRWVSSVSPCVGWQRILMRPLVASLSFIEAYTGAAKNEDCSAMLGRGEHDAVCLIEGNLRRRDADGCNWGACIIGPS